MRARRGYTLIELVSVTVILGVVAGITSPIIVEATESYARASERREASDAVGHAMERIVRVLREAPESDEYEGAPAITVATETSIEFEDGAEIRLDGETLWLAHTGEEEATLLEGVEWFELRLLGFDGVSDAMDKPEWARRVEVGLRAGGVELRTAVFLRSGLGS